MIHIRRPFCVPVVLPSNGHIVQAALTCVFEDGEVIVEIDSVKYHCIINRDNFLELSDHAEEKRIKQQSVDAVSYIGQVHQAGK